MDSFVFFSSFFLLSLKKVLIFAAKKNYNSMHIFFSLLVWLVLVLSFPLSLLANTMFDTHPMRTLTIYEGLAGESVYCIFRSHDGMTWFGTTNGITVYDGNNMHSYSLNALRSKNYVHDIAETSDGHIWVAANSGLYVLNEQVMRFVPFNSTLDYDVRAIESSGDTLFAATERGLNIISQGKGRQVWLTPNHLSSVNHVNDIEVDQKGRVWLIGDNELYRYEITSAGTDSILPLGIAGQLHIINNLRNMTVAGDTIYIGTYNDGLLVYDINENSVHPYVDISCPVIPCLSHDADHLYVGTDGEGLYVISLDSNKVVKHFVMNGPEYPLIDNTVYSFLRDDDGNSFFGYYRRGVQHSYHVEHLFHCYRNEQFDSRDINIRSICIDDDVKVLGLRGGLYFIDERRGISKFFSPDELGGSIVTNIVKYDGFYYCCTFNGGVMRIDPQRMLTSRISDNEALSSGSFGALVVSPDNELWMAGNLGVFIYDSRTQEVRVYDSHNSQLPDAYANDLLFDRQGRCWISTAEGICLYDPIDRTIRRSGYPDGFFANLHESRGILGDKDNLVFSCLDGLYRTNEELTVYEEINTTQTIGNEYVSQVIYDKRYRNYWIATERGFFRADPAFTSIAKYAQEVGLASREFSSGAICIDSQNRLWTGTVNGLFYADLDELQKYDAGDNPVILSEATIDGSPLNPEGRHSMYFGRQFSLTYNFGVQELSFLPLILNYSDPEGQCFEYKILGNGESMDDNEGWIVLKNRERAIISDGFSLGHNLLRVRQSGQSRYTEYQINVWPSQAFIFEIIIIILLMIAVSYSYIERRALKRQRAETARIQQELEEAKRKYSRVLTTDDESQRLYKRLDEYMRTEKPYLNNDLKLSDIASHLEVSTVKLSQLLNIFIQKNYYDFVNTYRLEEFKLRLGDKRFSQYTLLALAEECGFKRSSFFSTFKKVEGVTPTEYVRRLNEK